MKLFLWLATVKHVTFLPNADQPHMAHFTIMTTQHCLESFDKQISKFWKCLTGSSTHLYLPLAWMLDLTYDVVKVYTRSGPNLNIYIFYNPIFFSHIFDSILIHLTVLECLSRYYKKIMQNSLNKCFLKGGRKASLSLMRF